MLKRLLRKSNKGAALLEYALLVAGIALIGSAAVSMFGHKTTDLIGTVTAVMPGAHLEDNNPIVSGQLMEVTSAGGAGGIGLDAAAINAAKNTGRLNKNVGFDDGTADSPLIVEP